jgi:hypothetical protein
MMAPAPDPDPAPEPASGHPAAADSRNARDPSAAPAAEVAAPAPAPNSGPPPPHDAGGPRLTRRAVLQSAGVLAAGGIGVAAGFALRDVAAPAVTPSPSAPLGLVAAATGSPAPTATEAPAEPVAAEVGPRHAFRSRPDLRPPVLVVGTPAAGTAPGLLFTTPNNGEADDGPTIYDETGQPVWVRPGTGERGDLRRSTDLHVVAWDGRPALAWWEGDAVIGVGNGAYVIADETYTEIARIAADGSADLHELQLTDRGTALYLAYERVPMPVTAGGASPGPRELYDCVVYEVDVRTGEVRFAWHSAEHVAPDESSAPLPEDPEAAHDPVHANSVHEDDDGNLLVSARNTSCVYKVDRATGEVLWRLGGTKGDIELLDGLTFGLQHDARRQADGTITIYDNGSPPTPGRGIVVEVDETARTARLLRTFERPEPLHTSSQGSFQLLPNGNVLVGWGSQAVMTEFAPSGAVLFDAALPAGVQSYRDRRHPWTGRPADPPALAVDPVVSASGSQRRVTAYASWNGATEVARWTLLAGGAEGELEPLATLARTGFETVLVGMTTLEQVSRVQAIALDASGGELGRTGVLAPG